MCSVLRLNVPVSAPKIACSYVFIRKGGGGVEKNVRAHQKIRFFGFFFGLRFFFFTALFQFFQHSFFIFSKLSSFSTQS